ncbi:MAG: hypothetical protein M1399_07545 [Actinobacteria bacterium]|nr:hypothetical protein [Actinomycetota bacterium]MCL5447033.1 hypothetical protein [Actinomycetota bacterium]
MRRQVRQPGVTATPTVATPGAGKVLGIYAHCPETAHASTSGWVAVLR